MFTFNLVFSDTPFFNCLLANAGRSKIVSENHAGVWSDQISQNNPAMPRRTNSSVRPVYLATANRHKVVEIQAMFADSSVQVLEPRNIPSKIEENGTTFSENARIKAVAFAESCSGWALSDDSGISIDALHGGPGVYSSRFLGPQATDADRNARLLQLLTDIEPEARTARYICAVAVADPDGRIVFETTAVCEGRIASTPSGVSGFGYDPIFLLVGLQRTMADLSAQGKNQISHRGKAVRAARLFLELYGSKGGSVDRTSSTMMR